MNKYPSDGFAGFAVNGKARIIGAVKAGETFAHAKDVTPFFAVTLDELKAAIAAAGYTL